MKTFCSIQAAINDAATLTGHTLEVYPGTYNEQVLVNKEVTIKQATATKPVIDFTGTPGLASGKLTLFEVTSPNVTIEGLDYRRRMMTEVGSAVIAKFIDAEQPECKDQFDINLYRSWCADGIGQFAQCDQHQPLSIPRINSSARRR
ncbi:MAG: hypothetical protein IPH77_15815 [Ignavibacteria bacterium]|nr:hypothetical protein [Ignavibacteria bacterium]